MARALEEAEAEGRVVHRLPLDKIEIHHLARDRMILDEDEMSALVASIEARGQQTAVEVVRLSGGRYGLISGLRRIAALKRLGRTDVLALVRQPENSQDAYRAMIEENEIRAGLSFYERANIAVRAVGQGVYPTAGRAVQELFAHVPSARRSKILRFVLLREKLGPALTFPTAIPEKLGLRMASEIDADRGFAARLSDALRKTPPADAAAERRAIERALAGKGRSPAAKETLAKGVTLQARAGRAVLTGQGVDDALLEALRDWLVSHAKEN